MFHRGFPKQRIDSETIILSIWHWTISKNDNFYKDFRKICKFWYCTILTMPKFLFHVIFHMKYKCCIRMAPMWSRYQIYFFKNLICICWHLYPSLIIPLLGLYFFILLYMITFISLSYSKATNRSSVKFEMWKQTKFSNFELFHFFSQLKSVSSTCMYCKSLIFVPENCSLAISVGNSVIYDQTTIIFSLA